MPDPLRLLIVEDEQAIRDGLVDVFVYHGFEVNAVADGQQGLSEALSGRYDLILLDVMLPGIDGFQICNQVRESDRDQPIIMLTAKTSDEDIVHGLTLGADDYVAKPFSVAQLVLRVKAVLRRARPTPAGAASISLGDELTIDVPNLAGQLNGKPIAFTRREMQLLCYLHANAGTAVTRDELLVHVWGYAKTADIETRTVDIHIAKLRRKIEPDPATPQFLTTVRGAGYRLVDA